MAAKVQTPPGPLRAVKPSHCLIPHREYPTTCSTDSITCKDILQTLSSGCTSRAESAKRIRANTQLTHRGDLQKERSKSLEVGFVRNPIPRLLCRESLLSAHKSELLYLYTVTFRNICGRTDDRSTQYPFPSIHHYSLPLAQPQKYSLWRCPVLLHQRFYWDYTHHASWKLLKLWVWLNLPVGKNTQVFIENRNTTKPMHEMNRRVKKHHISNFNQPVISHFNS